MNNSSIYSNDKLDLPENIDYANLKTIVNMAVGFCVFVLCLITIISIFLAKTIRNKEKVCYMAIIFSDILLSCQILLVRLIPISYSSDHPLCHFRLWNGIALGLATIFSNVMVTTERFVSVVLPFRFSEKVTSKRLIVVYVFLWLFALMLTFGMFSDGFNGSDLCQFLFAGNRKGYAILGALMCFVILLDFSLYLCIINVIRRHIRQIAATMVDGNTVLERGSYIKKKELRATLTVGIITLAFGISYFPMGAHMLYYGIYSSLIPNSGTFHALLVIFMLNSLVNPVIYIWRLESCRKEIINRVLCRPVEIADIISGSG